MSTSDDKLFEDAMANLEMPSAEGAESGASPLAAPLAGVVPEARERTEAETFHQAMARLEIGDEHEGEEPPAPKQGRRPTGRRALQRAIRQGRVKADVTLDLHGLNRTQAWTAVLRCIQTARREGQGVVRVICGQGLHSQGPAVLLEALQEWLRGPLQEHVSTSHPAAPSDGGRGAWYLWLRPL